MAKPVISYILFGIGGALLLLAGIVIGRNGTRNMPVQPTVLSSRTAHPVVDSSSSPSLTNSGVPPGTKKVVRVVDGDTIELEGGVKVRYIGINAPESVDPRRPVQCFGAEASKKNKEFVENKYVRLEKDVSETDMYGRLLRYIWVGDTLINLKLIRQGYAQASSYPPDVKHQDEFRQAEQEARDAKRGLWGACPVSSPKPVPSGSAASVSTGPNGCTIKGNINASGEKVYHLPGCGSYANTKIDEPRGERWFCTEPEAQSAGWRKAGNCP